MTLKTPENLRKICEYMATPGAKIGAAMSVIGGSEKSHNIWAWLADDELLVAYPDETVFQNFASAMDAAKHIRLAKWYGQLISECEGFGLEESIIYNGEQQWQKDPEILGLLGPTPHPLDCFVFFGQHDPYLRRKNARGQMELVPLTVTRPASAHLKIHMARSLFPDLNPAERREVQNDSQISMLIVRRDTKPEEQMSPAELKEHLRKRLRDLDGRTAAAPVQQQIEPPDEPEPPPRPERRGPQRVDVNQAPDPKQGYRTA